MASGGGADAAGSVRWQGRLGPCWFKNQNKKSVYVSVFAECAKTGYFFLLCFNSSSSSLGAVVLVGVTPLITEKVN